MRNRVEKHDDMLRKKALSLLKKAGYETDYKIYCCDNDRGYCNYDKKIIIIPLWAIESGKESNKSYWVYYLAHELSHAVNCSVNNNVSSHDVLFMEFFKELCPKTLQKFELYYKPRNAKAAGIKR